MRRRVLRVDSRPPSGTHIFFFPLAVESLNDNMDNRPENLCWKVDLKLTKFKLQFYYNYMCLYIFMYILNAFSCSLSTE